MFRFCRSVFGGSTAIWDYHPPPFAATARTITITLPNKTKPISMIPLIFNAAERLVQIVIHTPSYYISCTILACATIWALPPKRSIYANFRTLGSGILDPAVWSQKICPEKSASWCEPHPHRQLARLLCSSLSRGQRNTFGLPSSRFPRHDAQKVG